MATLIGGLPTAPFQRRVELIDGDIVEMAPITVRHANVVDITADVLKGSLADRFRLTASDTTH